MDYSMINGAIQVWEINTNPHITAEGPDRIGPRKRVYDLAEQRFFSALKTQALAREGATTDVTRLEKPSFNTTLCAQLRRSPRSPHPEAPPKASENLTWPSSEVG